LCKYFQSLCHSDVKLNMIQFYLPINK
jgi:hypothetical protein